MKPYLTILPLAGLLAFGAVAPALAASAAEELKAQARETKEENALRGVDVTLAQAIATAEQQTSGKAFDAGADFERGKPRVVVETNGPKGVQTVIIDAQNGQVVGAHPGGEAD
ncbi:MAG TPA: PepSY domain-containing protein [Acetobacteraceae bacterium]|jgi:uncharacterized membrane protein YkoI|nr:PepSY domain-containing protein [Acetobacteraceae bacterium]